MSGGLHLTGSLPKYRSFGQSNGPSKRLRDPVRDKARRYHRDEPRLELRYQKGNGIQETAEPVISDPKTAAGRPFLKSLNILLRYARLYGFAHARTAEQLCIAFEELVAAIPSESGLLLGAAGSRLSLDGVPLEGAAEKQFAHRLSAGRPGKRPGFCHRHPHRTGSFCAGVCRGQSQAL